MLQVCGPEQWKGVILLECSIHRPLRRPARRDILAAPQGGWSQGNYSLSTPAVHPSPLSDVRLLWVPDYRPQRTQGAVWTTRHAAFPLDLLTKTLGVEPTKAPRWPRRVARAENHRAKCHSEVCDLFVVQGLPVNFPFPLHKGHMHWELLSFRFTLGFFTTRTQIGSQRTTKPGNDWMNDPVTQRNKPSSEGMQFPLSTPEGACVLVLKLLPIWRFQLLFPAPGALHRR